MPPKRRPDEADDGEEEEYSDEEVDAAGKNKFEPLQFIGNQHWQRRTVKDLIDLIDHGYLDLEPDYQRDVVWIPDRMTKLINSLMAGYYVPPLIFNTKKISEHKYMRIAIDGKQRLTSMKKFVNGEIPCTDAHNRRWYFKLDEGVDQTRVTRRTLPLSECRKFLKLELLTCEYSELEQKQEEDLFSRVQLGMPLTPAEKLKATSGPWQKFAIEIENKYSDLLTVIENKRARGFHLILQILKQILREDDTEQKYTPGVASLKGFLERETDFLDDQFRIKARRVFDTYATVKRDHPKTFENNNYKHSTKFSPVEFVACAVLINVHPDRNARLLSGDILKFRSELRNDLQDLRSNTRTWKHAMRYIDELALHRGGAGVVPRAVRRSARVVPSEPPKSSQRQQTHPSSARKRPQPTVAVAPIAHMSSLSSSRKSSATSVAQTPSFTPTNAPPTSARLPPEDDDVPLIDAPSQSPSKSLSVQPSDGPTNSRYRKFAPLEPPPLFASLDGIDDDDSDQPLSRFRAVKRSANGDTGGSAIKRERRG